MVLVAIALTVSVASATDWPQFQKDGISIGWTTDHAPIHDPELAWSHNVSGWVDTTPIVGDGQVFVLSASGTLYAYDVTNGTENWHTDLTPGTGNFELSVPAYHNGIVYAAVSSGAAGQGAGRVCAVYASNGSIRESKYYGLNNFQLNTPITYADGKIYIGNWKGGTEHTEDNGTYYCIDASDVTHEIWNRTAPYVTGYYWAGAAIVGDYIIYGDDRANVTCLNKDNGTFVDYVNVSEAPFDINDPVEEIRSSIRWDASTSRIYFTGKKAFPSHTGHAYTVGFDSTTGYFNTADYWVTDINYSTSTPVVYNDRVYVCMGGVYGGDSMVLKCLNETNGNILDTYTITCPPTGPCGSQSSPAVSVVDGHVYIYFTTNVQNGSAYCVENVDDTLVERWVWDPPGADDQFILQGVVISDGFVYFGTDGSYVYALKEGQEQFDIPIYNNMNLIAIPLIQDDTSLGAVFDIGVPDDVVRKYVNSEGIYHSARYFSGYGWHEYEVVEPIEPEVGYVYERAGVDCTLTVHGTRCTGTISTPIYNGINLIGYVNFTSTDLSTFNSPVDGDVVRRYVNSEGIYHTARYFDGYGWHEYEVVNPIEVGVGYYYERAGANYDWTYEA
jgi:outer membrane protein assembly factor BamB